MNMIGNFKRKVLTEKEREHYRKVGFINII